MAQFLTTTGVSYRLEEIIQGAEERLVIISPFLRVNDRLKELLEDKDRLKLDTRVVYGKADLQPAEITWLESMSYIRTSFCKNLHAKCYLNEDYALLTSMNLYEFSQVNNYEMGVLVARDEEGDLYDAILSEAMRIVRVSEEIRVTVARVTATGKAKQHSTHATERHGRRRKRRRKTKAVERRARLTDDEVFRRLKAWRIAKARAEGKPAYTVLTDRTLKDLATTRPERIDELAAVNGIGPAKLESYAREILDVVAGRS